MSKDNVDSCRCAFLNWVEPESDLLEALGLRGSQIYRKAKRTAFWYGIRNTLKRDGISKKDARSLAWLMQGKVFDQKIKACEFRRRMAAAC